MRWRTLFARTSALADLVELLNGEYDRVTRVDVVGHERRRLAHAWGRAFVAARHVGDWTADALGVDDDSQRLWPSAQLVGSFERRCNRVAVRVHKAVVADADVDVSTIAALMATLRRMGVDTAELATTRRAAHA